jgi:hypothetical protein
MSIPASFDNEADFVRTLSTTHEHLIPLIKWLDNLHDADRRKVTSAAFVLLGQRILQVTPCTHDETMEEMSALYRMIMDGGVDNFLQDNGAA